MKDSTGSDLATALQHARAATTASFWQPVLRRQRETTQDREDPAGCWISRLMLPRLPKAEADGVCALLRAVIEHLGSGVERYDLPTVEDVPVHWVGGGGQAASGNESQAISNISEIAKFKALSAEAKRPLTIMYAYGGAH